MIESISAVTVEAAKFLKEALTESLKEAGETTLKESPVQSMMETIENTSLETLKAQNIETINSRLESSLHPETKVPYRIKTVEDIDGNKVKGVFPDFKEHSIFEVKLPENLLQASDVKQFEYCDVKLKDSYDKGTLNTDKFTERQLEQINNGDKPEGFTWHHNEVKGRMELVEIEIHQATAHTGGKSIWGGGKEAR